MPNLDKYKKWFEIMKTLDTFSTKEESLSFAKAAIKQILTLEKKVVEKNNKELDSLKELFNKFQTVKGAEFDKIKLEAKQLTDKLFKEQTDNLNFLKDKVRNTKNGKDGKDGKDGVDGENGSSDTPKEQRDKLESLKGKERLNISAISGLKKEIKALKKMFKTGKAPMYTGMVSGYSGGHSVLAYDLSSQLDGSTREFSLPAFWRVISVHLSSFPNILRFTTDYTTDADAMKITFTSEVPDASLNAGQSLIIIYSEH